MWFLSWILSTPDWWRSWCSTRGKCRAGLWLLSLGLLHILWRNLRNLLYVCLQDCLGFLQCLLRTKGIFLFFLNREGVQKPDFGCFQWDLNGKLPRRVLYLCWWKCLLSLGGLVFLIGRLVDWCPVLDFCSNELSMYFDESRFVASPCGVAYHFHNVETSW